MSNEFSQYINYYLPLMLYTYNVVRVLIKIFIIKPFLKFKLLMTANNIQNM